MDKLTHINEFLIYCKQYLNLNKLPKIQLKNDAEWSIQNKSFGGYIPGTSSMVVNIYNRHQVDVFRTIAHELIHYKQDLENRLYDGAGETGSEIENEANSEAGIILRNFAKSNPDIFE